MFRMISLAQDQLGVRDIERAVKCRAACALDAMIGPKDLRPIIDLDCLEGTPAFVGRGEGMMAGRMPILRQDHVLERAGNAIDEGNGFIGSRNGERASSAKVILDVDDEQDIGFADFNIVHGAFAPSWARRRSVSSVRRNRGSDIVTG